MILAQYLGNNTMLLWFFTFWNTASIVIRFCDALQFISPYIMFCILGVSVAISVILTSFPISTVTQEKNEVF